MFLCFVSVDFALVAGLFELFVGHGREVTRLCVRFDAFSSPVHPMRRFRRRVW